MKLWDLYCWSKHEYNWRWIGMSVGDTAYDAIRDAKKCLPNIVARNDVMRVIEFVECGQTLATIRAV